MKKQVSKLNLAKVTVSELVNQSKVIAGGGGPIAVVIIDAKRDDSKAFACNVYPVVEG